MDIEYLEHTSDMGLRARGTSMSEAFCQAAVGMFEVMVCTDHVRPETIYAVDVSAESAELLLVAWLSTLLARKDVTGHVFSRFAATIEHANAEWHLRGIAKGEILDAKRHAVGTEVKGISYLGLAVGESDGEWIAQCVLDV